MLQDDDDVITKRLKMQALEHKNKLFYKLADSFCGNSEWNIDHEIACEKTFLKGHKQAITCLQWAPGNQHIVTGSKDCSLIKWDLES